MAAKPSQQTSTSSSTPSSAAIRSAEHLYYAIREPFPEAVRHFESRWTAAHAVCHSQKTSAAGDAATRTEEFDALRRLGPKIIPFIVYKLAEDESGDSDWAVHLYNMLESDPEYRPILYESLRWRRNRIVELNYQRNQIVQQRIHAWEAYHRQNFLQSNTYVFTCCEEYEDLLELGTSIVAPLMVAYYHNPQGYYYELLHEIFHGRKMGAYMVHKGTLFEECCSFFNEGEHENAPIYIQTPDDRWIFNGEIVGKWDPN